MAPFPTVGDEVEPLMNIGRSHMALFAAAVGIALFLPFGLLVDAGHTSGRLGSVDNDGDGPGSAGQGTTGTGSGAGGTPPALLPPAVGQMVAPGGNFSATIPVVNATEVMITNLPRVNGFGFDTAANFSAITDLAIVVHGTVLGHVPAFNVSVPLPSAFSGVVSLVTTLNTTGIVDGSTFAYRVATGNGAFEAALVTARVTATNLTILPQASQPFGPYVADGVARLIAMVPSDVYGNVDRHSDVMFRATPTGTAAPPEYDVSDSVAVHGDAELSSPTPLRYSRPMSAAAHHPAALEHILRDADAVPGVVYGTATFHAAHMVEIGPFATDVTVTASVGGPQGPKDTVVFHLDAAPTTEQTRASAFQGDVTFPGTAIFHCRLVNGTGASPQGKVWVSFIDTPDSHNATLRRQVQSGTEFDQVLAAPFVGKLPLGNFVPSDVAVTAQVGHGRGALSGAANGGEPIHFVTGQNVTVDIPLGTPS